MNLARENRALGIIQNCLRWKGKVFPSSAEQISYTADTTIPLDVFVHTITFYPDKAVDEIIKKMSKIENKETFPPWYSLMEKLLHEEKLLRNAIEASQTLLN